MTSALDVAVLHQKTFGAYKNAHQGHTLVLVATGPTLNDYKPIEGTIHVGVNKAYQREDLGYELNHMFVQDYLWAQSYFDAFCTHTNSQNPVKFFGIVPTDAPEYPNSLIPQDVLNKHGLAYGYYVDYPDTRTEPTFDIENEKLCDFNSVVFSAMQFMLYTNPSKIYIVGCDCSSAGHFDSKTHNTYDDPTIKTLIDGWKKMKVFAENYYPETKIISVNPVGLKGLFPEIT